VCLTFCFLAQCKTTWKHSTVQTSFCQIFGFKYSELYFCLLVWFSCHFISPCSPRTSGGWVGLAVVFVTAKVGSSDAME
jgi:hypothetical protein